MNPPSSPYRFVIAGLLLAFNLTAGLNFAAAAPILPLIMEHYGLSRGEASLLSGLVIALQAAFLIPAGMLVARVPVKAILLVGWLMSGAMVLTPLAGHFYVLLALRVCLGLSYALMLPAFAPLIMRWFSGRELPVVNSVNFSFFTLGLTAAAFITPPLSQVIGWQPTLAVFGGALLAGAVAWWVLGRVPPESGAGVQRVSVRDLLRALRARTTLLLGLADASAFAQYVALATWLPTYYHEVRGMSLASAGSIVGLIPMTGIGVVLLSGVLGARLGLRRPLFMVAGVVAGLAGFGSFLAQDTTLIRVSAVALGFGGFFYLPALLTVPMELKGATPASVAIVWAAVFALASVLAFVAPITVGLLTDALGSYIPGLALWAAAGWGLFVAGLLLPETGPRARRAAQPAVQA